MPQDERQLRVIREYAAMLETPTCNWPEIEFDTRVARIWAVSELYKWVICHMEWTVMRAVKEFGNLVAEYSCIVDNYSEANFIFEIALEEACNIEDILVAMS